MKDIPIIINSYNRVTPLKKLIEWLLNAGYNNIEILDNNSTYEPLLDYYKQIRVNRDITISRLSNNYGSHGLWNQGVFFNKNYPFVYTDSDIIPIEGCPSNIVEYFLDILNTFTGCSKVGFGLKIDDLPNHFKHKNDVITWESQFWKNPLQNNIFSTSLYDSLIDTTFAVYRPNLKKWTLNGIRTGYPFLARHTTWYEDSNSLSEEEIYYKEHLDEISGTWSRNEIPDWLKLKIDENR